MIYLCYFLFAFCIKQDNPVFLNDTELYLFLNETQYISLDKEAYVIVDMHRDRVLFFDAEGSRQRDLTRKGSGPGEVSKPLSVYYVDEKIYLLDQYFVHVFDKKGTFLSSLKKPDHAVLLVKLKDGWIGVESLLENDHFYEQLVVYNDGLTRITTLQTEPNPEKDPWLRIEPPPFVFPSPTTLLMPFDKNRYAVCKLKNGKGALVYDSKTGEKCADLLPNLPLVPFDPAAVEHYIPEGLEAKVTFPEFWPEFQSVRILDGQRLLLLQYSPRTFGSEPFSDYKNLKEFNIFNAQGEKMPYQEIDGYSRRVLLFDQTHAHILSYNLEKDEYTVAVVPKSDLKDFVTKNPLPEPEWEFLND